MKTTTTQTKIHIPEVEKLINQCIIETNLSASKAGQLFAVNKRPEKDEPSLLIFVGNILARFEKLGADVAHLMQTSAGFQTLGLQAEKNLSKIRDLNKEIETNEDNIAYLTIEIGSYDSKAVSRRFWIALWTTIALGIGEVFFNSYSFALLGNNLAMNIFIALSVAVGVLTISHFVPLIYKKLQSPIKRIILTLGSVIGMLILFTILANLRRAYLFKHGIETSSWQFIVLNLFFFVVSMILSHQLMPTLDELKVWNEKKKMEKEIEDKRAKVLELKKEIERLQAELTELAQFEIQKATYANYVSERIRKAYKESVEIFKNSNLHYRKDRVTPDCFRDAIPSIQLETINIQFTNKITKP